MKIESVTWKQGARNAGIDPEEAFQALEQIRDENNGDLTDDNIVAAARRKSHKLHLWFTWDDTKAAREYRRSQARELIRSFRVTYTEAPESQVRAYEVHVRGRSGGEQRTAYRTTEDVLADPDARDRLIASAIRMAMEFRRRFRGIHELDKVMEAIDKTLVEIGEGE